MGVAAVGAVGDPFCGGRRRRDCAGGVRELRDERRLRLGVTSPNAIREQNREDTILVQQQQAPHVVKLKAGAVAGERSARGSDRIHDPPDQRRVDGRADQSSSCRPAAARAAARSSTARSPPPPST